MPTVAAPPKIARPTLAQIAQYAFKTNFWSKQLEAAAALQAKPSAMVAVKSCHASGKTFTAARLGLAFLMSDPGAKVLTTAPTWKQVEKVLWGEVHAAVEQCRFKLPEPTSVQLKITAGNWMMGLSTDDSVNFQGYHGKILIILDEAAGIDDGLFEAIKGIRAAGDVSLLALGNPTVVGGRFYDAFEPGSPWYQITISAFDTPNFKHATEDRQITLEELLAMPEHELHDNPMPWLVQKWWVREIYEEDGPDSVAWYARVLGEFPDETEDSVFPKARIEAADRPPERPEQPGKLKAGIDVAGPGEDETTIAICEGGALLHMDGWADQNPRDRLQSALEAWGGPDAYEVVAVDVIGVGFHMATWLEELGYPVRYVNVSESARNKDKFERLRDEIYWSLRMKLIRGEISGLSKPNLKEQLRKVKYEHTLTGKVKIESKRDAKKRGVDSPDYAEALILAQAPTYTVPTEVERVRREPDELDSLPSQGPNALASLVSVLGRDKQLEW